MTKENWTLLKIGDIVKMGNGKNAIYTKYTGKTFEKFEDQVEAAKLYKEQESKNK